MTTSGAETDVELNIIMIYYFATPLILNIRGDASFQPPGADTHAPSDTQRRPTLPTLITLC
jgi:hypothetical protein